MNVYDFDGTIYDGDSGEDLIKYAMKKHPFLVMKCLRKAKSLNRACEKGMVSFEQVKEELFSFIYKINNYPKFLNDFVDSHMYKIKALYKSRQTDNDVIVTASLDIWINLFANRMGVKNVLATRFDVSGKIIGINCKGYEKVRRLSESFPNVPVVNAYSDEKSDEYLLKMAQNGFVVEGNRVIPYVEGYNFKK